MNEYIEIKEDEKRSDDKGEYTVNSRIYREDIEKEIYPKELYAGFFIRMFSFLVDGIIANVFVKILLGGFLNLTGIYISPKVYWVLSTFITLLYFTIGTYVTNGQTIGKAIFSLRVVKLDGEKLDLITVIIREFFGRFIHTYGILSLLYLLTAFTEKKQNLSDLFADTSVINISKEEAYNLGRRENSIYS